MFWGDRDTTVKFCETPYKHSKYVAEYHNTLSGFIYILVGYLYIKQNRELAFSCISLGVGTILLHCTQKHYLLNKNYKKIYTVFLVSLYLYFYNNFQVFIIMFTVLIILLINETKSLSYNKRYYKNLFIVLIIFATICWILDQIYCDYVKEYNLHSIWHILTGLCAYIGFKILI